MKRQITFNLDNTDSFLDLTKKYFRGNGFKLASEATDELRFIKGSTLLNMVTFNPLNWKSEIKVILTNSLVDASFDINTVGQMVTPKEERLWDLFVENYKISVTEKVDMTSANKNHIHETKTNNWTYAKHALIGAVVVGVPFGFLAYITELDMLASIGASIGAISFMANKINKDKLKESK